MVLSLSIAAGLVAILGLAWLFFPARMLGLWQARTDEIGLFLGRHDGLTLLGFALMLGLSLQVDPSPAWRAVLLGSLFTAAAMAVLNALGLRRGLIGAGARISVLVECLLALLFLLLLGRTHG